MDEVLSSALLEVVAIEKNDDNSTLTVTVIAQGIMGNPSATFPVDRNIVPEIGDHVRFSITKE